MKNCENHTRIIIIILCSLFIRYNTEAQHGIEQDNPVLTPNAAIVPTIDGIGNDDCWQNVPWQRIAQVWIPYGATIDSQDYYGRYKVVWSSTSNLLYFLMEVNDDVFVDGYTPSGGGAIYDYDISEIFIDENKSGGDHIFDTGTTNAENAFSYHMYAALPDAGQVTTDVQVDDLDGTGWNNARRPNYRSHFPDFAYRVNGTKAIREFSLKVYNDTYEDALANPETARVQLSENKEIGLSIAYCDNDDAGENPKVRDNMFGSVWEAAPGNMHWMNADGYGTLKLVSGGGTGVQNKQPLNAHIIKLYPNPSSSTSTLEVEDSYRGDVTINLYNLLGQELFRTSASKVSNTLKYALQLQQLPPSMYFVQMNLGQKVYSERLLIIP